MKKLVVAVVLGVLLGTACLADRTVHVYVGDQRLPMQPGARIHNGTTYGPLRASAEAIGATVEWNAATNTATICQDGRRVPIHRQQGITVNGSIMIPVRLMSEALGRTVEWDRPNQAVRIHSDAAGGGQPEQRHSQPRPQPGQPGQPGQHGEPGQPR